MTRLTHVTFQVKDFDESINFCKDWFQLEIHKDRRPYTVWMTTKEQNKKETPDFIFVLEKVDSAISAVNHFGFQINDRAQLDTLAEKARARNILLEGPTDIGGVVGSFIMIKDPNGHMWEFTHGQPLGGL
jgi:lactoylglutathione lyase